MERSTLVGILSCLLVFNSTSLLAATDTKSAPATSAKSDAAKPDAAQAQSDATTAQSDDKIVPAAPGTQAQIDDAANKDAIKMMKKVLNITVKSVDEIKTAILPLYSNYFAKLRQCTPGTYKYALPSPTGGSYDGENNVISPLYYFPVSVIQGMHDKKCMVDTKYTLFRIGDVEIKCQYNQDSLKVFTDDEAKYVVNGNLDTADPASKVNIDQCVLTVDGQEYATSE